ncbi:ERF family protein [Bradyrhizobium elkanii]|uniref:ERF family protein n=1 Tax=Bradyrhizobium elkanii TaxID=29448 RepID=UPI0035131BBE
MMQSEQINELAAALSKAQGAMQNAVMNRTNPHFRSKYADLSSVLDAIRGPLAANGLSTVQTMHIGEGSRMILRTTLMHSSGQYIASEYPLPLTGKPQEMGSAQTYARRYSLAALVCNASEEDDDGNAAQAAKNGNGNGQHKAAADGSVSVQQLRELESLIEEVHADTDKFCKFLKVEDLAALPAAQFERAKQALEAKRAPQ